MLVEAADAVAVEAGLVDFQRGAEQQFRIELLDREADRLRGGVEAAVSARRREAPRPASVLPAMAASYTFRAARARIQCSRRGRAPGSQGPVADQG
jgi:hypothetical protein